MTDYKPKEISTPQLCLLTTFIAPASLLHICTTVGWAGCTSWRIRKGLSELLLKQQQHEWRSNLHTSNCWNFALHKECLKLPLRHKLQLPFSSEEPEFTKGRGLPSSSVKMHFTKLSDSSKDNCSPWLSYREICLCQADFPTWWSSCTPFHCRLLPGPLKIKARTKKNDALCSSLREIIDWLYLLYTPVWRILYAFADGSEWFLRSGGCPFAPCPLFKITSISTP